MEVLQIFYSICVIFSPYATRMFLFAICMFRYATRMCSYVTLSFSYVTRVFFCWLLPVLSSFKYLPAVTPFGYFYE